MKFKIPETLDGLDLEQLSALETAAVEEFDALRDDPDLNAAGLKDLKALAAFVASARKQTDKLVAAAEKVEAEIAALTASVHPDGEPEVTEEPAADADAGEEPHSHDEPAEDPDKEPAVVASGMIRRQAAAARRSPATREPQAAMHDRSIVVRAAADVGGRFASGQTLESLDDLGEAFLGRIKQFPISGGRAFRRAQTRLKHGVAIMERPLDGAPLIKSAEGFWDQLDALTDQKRLAGGNIMAAGGWCAPNLQVWDLCPGLETTAGMGDWPAFRLERGGINFPTMVEFRTIYADANLDFHQVEADSISGTDKVCYDIPCPTQTDARLEIDGICFKQDIVQNAIWPEVTRDAIKRAMIAHEHKINARLIAQMETGSTAQVLALGSDLDGDQTTTGVLGALSFMGQDYRYRLRMDPEAVLEVMLPYWFREWIRADMARVAQKPYMAISDAQIGQWFSARYFRVQWVYDWQDGFVNGGAAGFGGTVQLTQWPTTLRVMMYAPGTWAKGGNGIIDLSAIYDSTGLRDNEYTAAFTEESVLLLRRCYPSYKATIPICPSGVTAELVPFDCSAA